MYMNKSNLKKTADHLSETLNEYCHHHRFFQWILAVLDVIKSKIYKPPPVKHKRKSPFNICKIFFDNKACKFINLPSIFHDSVVRFGIHNNILILLHLSII